MKREWMKKFRRMQRKAFTLAETLIVVAIILILGIVGIVSVMTYQRSLHQKQVDRTAQEIFVAAQNHLSMAASQGFLEREGEEFGSAETVEGMGTGVFYFVVSSADNSSDDPDDAGSVLNLMMPFGSIDETVRDGSYIIRYQRDPAIVLDVFYAEEEGRYSHSFTADEYTTLISNYRGPQHKSDRLRYKGSVIGYYGGELASEIKKGAIIYAPEIEIDNGEKLLVIVRNDSRNESRAQLKLVVTGKTSGAKKEIVLVRQNGESFTQNSVTDAGCPFTYESVTYTVTLDDITGSGSHFAELFSDFIPGEDISVQAIAFNNSVFTNVGMSAEKDTNSLYGSMKRGKAEISNFRHLENLEPEISGLDLSRLSLSQMEADQTTDLTWNDEGSIFSTSVQVYPVYGAASKQGTYMPVCPDPGFTYDGKDHKISGLKVDTTEDAGLFGILQSDSAVRNLELEDFSIVSSGNAGALAGMMTDTDVSGVLVHNNNETSDGNFEITAKNTAGGLVGAMSGGSIKASAAAVYVRSTNGTAGGLAGSITGSAKINNSYSGGHTVNARYSDALTGEARANVNGAGNAGGLVGTALGSSFEIAYSYSTCSVYGGNPGGFIGNAESGRIGHTYCTGRVIGTGTEAVGAFFGKKNGTSFLGDNYYLINVSSNIREETIQGITGVSGKDTTVTDFIVPEEQRQGAVTYDTTLMTSYLGKYYFPTIEQLNLNGTDKKAGITDRHYGDWQIPSLSALPFDVWNDDTLRTTVTLEDNAKSVMLTVTGEESQHTKAYLFSIDSNDNVKIERIGYVHGNGFVWESSSDNESKAKKLPVWIRNDILTIQMDDITRNGMHFYELFCCSPVSAEANLIPGENVDIRIVQEEVSWQEMKTTEAQPTNSLYAVSEKPLGNARISYFRHLQNLDPNISHVDSRVDNAKMLRTLDWAIINRYTDPKVFSNYDTIYSVIEISEGQTRAVSGTFYALYNKYLKSFDGGNYLIKNLVIHGASAEIDTVGAGNAGLFRLIDREISVKNLEMTDTEVTADDGKDAGTVAAVVEGADTNVVFNTVLAKASVCSVSGKNAGGLAGRVNGTLEVINSAGSSIVRAAGGPAGGLIGLLEGGSVDIQNSYSGGHTSNKKYSTEAYNIVSTNNPAGGLIGMIQTDSEFYAKQVFSSSSVSSGSHQGGGIVGKAESPFTIDTAYVIAPVSAIKVTTTDASTASGAFIGEITAGTTVENFSTYYLPEIYSGSTFSDEDGVKVSSVAYKGDGAGDLEYTVDLAYYEKDEQGNIIYGKLYPDSIQVKTYSFDNKLKGREYPFSVWTSFEDFPENKSIRGTGAMTYYGDWQPVITPATITHPILFKYHDPRAYAGPYVDLDNMEQVVVEGEDNTLFLPPASTYRIRGYLVDYWMLYDVKTGEYVELKKFLPEDVQGGEITIPKEYCGNTAEGGDAPELVLIAEYVKDERLNVSFWYDKTGANEDFGTNPITETTFDRDTAKWSDIASFTPSRNISGYSFVGWYSNSDFTQPVNFEDTSLIKDWVDGTGYQPYSTQNLGDLMLFAKYEKIEYYTVTVDFLYQVDGGTSEHLNSVPRYRVEDEDSQYKIQKIIGEKFDEDVTLPSLTEQYQTDNITIERYLDDVEGTCTLNPDKKSIHVTAEKEAHFIVVYHLESGGHEQDSYRYKVMFKMHHTASNSTAANMVYNDTQTFTYDPYNSVFSAPNGTIPDIKIIQLEGFICQTNEIQLSDSDSTAYQYIVYIEYERKQYTISFNSMSGTYVDPVQLYWGQPLSSGKPQNPTRTGYDFSGWELMKKGGSDTYEWSDAMPMCNLEATAVWSNGNTTYTVVIWRQRATDNKSLNQLNLDDQKTYDFAEMVTHSGKTGSSATVTTDDMGKADKGDYIGFKYRRNDSAGKTIAGNGTTVVNVYYDRKIITMNFMKSNQHYEAGYTEDSTDEGTYGKEGSNYIQLVKEDGQWKKTETYQVPVEKEETVNQKYTGTRYLIASSPSSSKTTYYYLSGGSMQSIDLFYNNGKYYRNRSGSFITGYTYSDEYTPSGTLYTSTSSTGSGNTYYGFVDGQFIRLTRNGRNDYSYQVTRTVTEYEDRTRLVDYNGTRYRKTGSPYTGLYGQPLSMYGYVWPAELKWTYSSTTMTYLGQFILPTQTADTITFTSGSAPGTFVYYYLQNADGTWPAKDDWNAKGGSGGGTFNFSEKYDGYTVYGYQSGNNYGTSDSSWTRKSAGGSVSSYSDPLRVGYARKSYDVSFYNVTNGNNIGSESVRYGATIQPITVPAPSATEESLGYFWDGKYYNDQACTQEFDFTSPMPSHPVIIYVRYVLPSYRVTFFLNDPDPSDGNPANYITPLTEDKYTFYPQKNQDLDDSIATASGELKDEYTPVKTGYKFRGWYYNDTCNTDSYDTVTLGDPMISQTNEHGFINSMGIQKHMKVYAKWDIAGEPPSEETRDIKVYHLTKDSLGQDVELHDMEVYADKPVGTTIIIRALNIEGYYAQNMVWYHTVTSADEQIVKMYYNEINPWHYDVEYYARYSSYETATDDEVGCEVTRDGYVDYLIRKDEDVDAFNQYQTIDFKAPEGFENYHLQHYEYKDNLNGTGTTLTIHPEDDGSKVLVKYYIEPDATSIVVGGSQYVYDGTSKGVPAGSPDLDNVFAAPNDDTTVNTRDTFRYYNANGETIPNDRVVNAGVYRMDGYLVLHVEGVPYGKTESRSDNFLIWKDLTKNTELIVNKRKVVLTSGSGEGLYGLPDDPDAHGILMKDEVVESGDGFAEGEGATYSFSVESFRKDVGSSENVFSYKLNSNTKESNYTIQTVYGSLVIYWQYNVELYAQYSSIDGAPNTVGHHAVAKDTTAYLIKKETGIKSYDQYDTPVEFGGVPVDYQHFLYSHYVCGDDTGEDQNIFINPQEGYTATVKFYIEPDYSVVRPVEDLEIQIPRPEVETDEDPAEVPSDEPQTEPGEEGMTQWPVKAEMPDARNDGRFSCPCDIDFIDAFTYYDPNQTGKPTPVDPKDIVEEGVYPMDAYVLMKIIGTAEGEAGESVRYFVIWMSTDHSMTLTTTYEGES